MAGLVVALGALVMPAVALANVDMSVSTISGPDQIGRGHNGSFDFDVTNNGTDAASNVSVTADSSSQLTFSSSSDSGSTSYTPGFAGNTLTFTATTPVAPGATHHFSLAYTGNAEGAATITVDVSTSSSDSNSQNDQSVKSLAVTGLTATPSPASFGSTAIGSISPAQHVTITNTTTTGVTLSALSTDVLALDDFLVSPGTCVPGTLAAGTSCAVVARFAPSALGNRSSGFTLPQSDGTLTNPHVVLSGTGVAPPTVEGPQGPQGQQGQPGPQGLPAFKLIVEPLATRIRAVAGHRVRFSYVSTITADAQLDVLRGGRRVARVKGGAGPGLNRLVWNGRTGRAKAKPGRYTLRLTAVNGSQTAVARTALALTRR